MKTNLLKGVALDKIYNFAVLSFLSLGLLRGQVLVTHIYFSKHLSVFQTISDEGMFHIQIREPDEI